MLSKLLRRFTAIAAVGLFVLAGCGAGGGGGGGGGDDGGTGPPTVVGYKYVLMTGDEVPQAIEITRGTATNQWLGVFIDSGESFWGTYTVLPSGIVKLVRTGYTNPAFVSPATLYAFEIVNGFMFFVTPDDAVGGSGGFENMSVAFNIEGSCDTITTQGDYNLVKTGQEEWDQSTDAGFGTAAFSTGETGVDLNASMFTLGMDLSGTPSGLSALGMDCTAGKGAGVADEYAFTATGMGVLTHFDGTVYHDFVALPEPDIAVDGGALMATGKTYVGLYQGMEDLGFGMQEVTYLVQALGDETAIQADSIVNPDTGELSGVPAWLTLARAGTADRLGMFDASGWIFGEDPTRIAVASAHPVGGKYVLVVVGQFDNDGDNEIGSPEDWFFMVLVEFESSLP